MWPANASALEAVWTALACGGLAFALWLFGMIWRSYRAVCAWIEQERAVKWGPRHKFVLGFLVGIGVLMLVWAGFVVLGVNALENAPPTTPGRAAASERAGWILVGLEVALLLAQVALLYAWIAVGGPSLQPHPVPKVRPS